MTYQLKSSELVFEVTRYPDARVRFGSGRDPGPTHGIDTVMLGLRVAL